MIRGAVRYRHSAPDSVNSASSTSSTSSGISPTHLLALVPAFILTAMPPIAASARDLGIRGATWIIAEPDFLSVIGDQSRSPEGFRGSWTGNSKKPPAGRSGGWRNPSRSRASPRPGTAPRGCSTPR